MRTRVLDIVRAIALFAGVVACELTTEAALPKGAVPLSPPRPYRLWWDLTERCSGMKGEFSRIKWYAVPQANSIEVDGQWVEGASFTESGRIVLAGNEVLSGSLVRHEMLHALTRGGHSREFFVERCGGVVACVRACEEEAGRPTVPPANAAEIGLDEVEVTFDAQPTAPSIAAESGWVALTVSVRNPNPFPVWVRLAPMQVGSPLSHTFGSVLTCEALCVQADLGFELITGHRYGMGPNETRRRTFDRLLSLGEFHARGTFNFDTTAEVVRTVRP